MAVAVEIAECWQKKMKGWARTRAGDGINEKKVKREQEVVVERKNVKSGLRTEIFDIN